MRGAGRGVDAGTVAANLGAGAGWPAAAAAGAGHAGLAGTTRWRARDVVGAAPRNANQARAAGVSAGAAVRRVRLHVDAASATARLALRARRAGTAAAGARLGVAGLSLAAGRVAGRRDAVALLAYLTLGAGAATRATVRGVGLHVGATGLATGLTLATLRSLAATTLTRLAEEAAHAADSPTLPAVGGVRRQRRALSVAAALPQRARVVGAAVDRHALPADALLTRGTRDGAVSSIAEDANVQGPGVHRGRTARVEALAAPRSATEGDEEERGGQDETHESSDEDGARRTRSARRPDHGNHKGFEPASPSHARMADAPTTRRARAPESTRAKGYELQAAVPVPPSD